jgi:hypothetical protein
MARLTDPSARERPIPRQFGVASIPESPGSNDGQGLIALGKSVEKGEDQIYTAQKHEEERINTLRAEDAFSKLRDRQLDLTYGQENGFTKLKGSDAVTKPVLTEWSKRFQDSETAIKADLTNDFQRQKFDKRAEVARLQFKEGILRHLATEGDTYSKEVFDGVIKSEEQSSVARWDSPNDIQSSLARVQNAVEERSDRYGWAPDYKNVVLKEANGKIHSAVIQQAIANNQNGYAQEWYEQHKDEIDLPTAKHLAVAVENGTQKDLVNKYNRDFLANEDSMPALETVRHEVLRDEKLTEDRKNILVGRIQSRQEVLDRRQEILHNKTLRIIEKGVNELNSNTLAGYEPNAEQFFPLLQMAKGTEMEGDVHRAIQLADATRGFRNAPPLVQEKMLTEAESAMRQPNDINVINPSRQEMERWGKRQDGSNKGLGFFGVLQRPDGNVSSELSFEFQADGKSISAPLIVPTLTRGEITHLLNGEKPTEAIYRKAQAFAMQRIGEGKSTFAAEGEQGPLPGGTNVSRFDRRVVDSWRTIYDHQRQQVQENPVSFAVRQGLIQEPAPLDLSKPDTIGPALTERFAISRAVSNRYQAPMKPFTPEEVTLQKNFLNGASVEQKRNYFASLSKASGPDMQGYMAIMTQLAPDDPVSAIAGSQAALGRSKESDLMLRGQAILRPSTKADGKPDGSGLIPMPPEADLRSQFDNYTREAFAGKAELRNAHYQAAKSIYAALSVDGGDKDTKSLDSKRWEQAMEMAVGKVDKYNGRRFVLPYSMDYGTFKNAISDNIEDLVDRSGPANVRLNEMKNLSQDQQKVQVQELTKPGTYALDPSWTPSRIRDLPVEAVGDGRYMFRVGDGVLVDRAKRPVIVDLNRSVAHRSQESFGAETRRTSEVMDPKP